MITIGFTGTQQGMTDLQKELVGRYLDVHKPTIAHHGDCIGADSDFHQMCVVRGINIVMHPPSNSSKRAFCEGGVECQPKGYITRNHDIVNASDVLLATPKGKNEELRSGTWATIRYALKQGVRTEIFYPKKEVL